MSPTVQLYQCLSIFLNGLDVTSTILLKGETVVCPIVPLFSDFFQNKNTQPESGTNGLKPSKAFKSLNVDNVQSLKKSGQALVQLDGKL